MNDRLKPWLSHYDQDVPPMIDIPAISLVDLFRESVKLYGDSIFTICKDIKHTYQDIDRLSDYISQSLASYGLQKGDRVGILLPNSTEFVVSYYGVLKAGCVVMALNPAYRPLEVAALAKESGVKALILESAAYQDIKAVQDQTAIQSVIVLDGETVALAPGDISWTNALIRGKDSSKVKVSLSPDDPAVFQYSGGTTGTPKCAIGLHRNLVANVCQFDHWLVNTDKGEETVLVAIPMYHVYGMVLGMNLAVRLGARMVLIPDPRDLDGLLSSIEQYRVTLFPGVPNIYALINNYPSVKAGMYDLSSIKACISGSTTLPTKVKHDFESLTKGHLVEGYGLSEAPTATHCNPILGENRAGSIGLPLPNVDCKVVDLETGMQELGVGEIGELVLKGPQVMAGYHRRPEETRLTLRDGWLHTGDVVRMDEDGYFYIVDRKKDVIKVGGFQVWPNEIEAVIRQHPEVFDVAVAGVRDVDGTEVAKAWVVLNEGAYATLEEIQSFCHVFLTGYKIPKYVEFRKTLPKTRVGKVLRRLLVEEETLARQ